MVDVCFKHWENAKDYKKNAALDYVTLTEHLTGNYRKHAHDVTVYINVNTLICFIN